jgi:hypothetical protein
MGWELPLIVRETVATDTWALLATSTMEVTWLSYSLAPKSGNLLTTRIYEPVQLITQPARTPKNSDIRAQ